MAKKSIGFGDDVEKLITLARLDRVAKLVNKSDNCSGCQARKTSLNNPNLMINKLFYPKNNEQTD